MPARRNGTRIARNLLVGVAILLVVGIAGSLYMGVRAQRAQVGAVVDQVTNIADRSLGLVFHPDDLTAPVSSARAAELDARVAAAVLDPSSFQSVTLWSQDGQILYSTQGRIGNTLESERDRVREALRGIPQTQNIGGTFSVMVPLSLRSGVGLPTAVELTTSAGAINAAPQPWRTNALFLLVLLAFVGIALYREIFRAGAGRSASAVAVERASAAGHVTSHGGRPVAAPPSPGLREEGDARRKAEDRARAAEERLATLQGQYRNTLEELQTSQRRIQEQAAAARPDPRLQEELTKAEQRAREQEVKARELQARLRVLEEEHRELARVTPDPALVAATTERLAEVTRERDALQHEHDALKSGRAGAEHERDALRTERDTLRTERDDLETQRVELAERAERLSAEVEAGAAATPQRRGPRAGPPGGAGRDGGHRSARGAGGGADPADDRATRAGVPAGAGRADEGAPGGPRRRARGHAPQPRVLRGDPVRASGGPGPAG
jgi:hypothetical protein